MELQHFSHDHVLILKEEHNDDDNGGGSTDLQKVHCCDVCSKQIISGPFYNCEGCDFFLHKSCSELPREIQHPLHREHPLALTSPSCFNGSTYYCDACKRDWKNVYVYHCSLCNFGLDLVCASITERTIEHPSHKHSLRILQRTSLSFCDACGTKHEGLFYACSTCDQYWIHQDCASLPTTFENTDYHDHPLTLAYSLPSQYTTFIHFCEICEKRMLEWLWVYYCGKCRFLVHVNCVTSKTEHFLSVLQAKKEFHSSRRSKIPVADDEFHLDVVHLPLQDEFLSLVDHFHKDIQLRAKLKTSFELYCHEQPLVLFDDVRGNDNRLDILHDHVKYQKTLCNACIKPITTSPFYKCVDHECNFIVHKCCEELPNEIRHQFHPEHPLVLSRIQDFANFMCKGCNIVFCNSFAYYCDCCDYCLDVICVTLPNTIKHGAHTDHPMSLNKNISRHCNACYDVRDKSTFAYSCGSCDFELHAQCATLPCTTRHRYDEEHPYSLTYRPIEDHDSDYCCDICETEINPLWWFYHCIDCDKSMHTWCHPTFDERSRIKFGGALTIEGHPHPLHAVPVIPIFTQCNGYVRVITQGTMCSKCGEDFFCQLAGYGKFYPTGFKCLECKYNLHQVCLSELTQEGMELKILKEF